MRFGSGMVVGGDRMVVGVILILWIVHHLCINSLASWW